MPLAEWNPRSYNTSSRSSNRDEIRTGLNSIYVDNFTIGLLYPDSVIQSPYTGDTHSVRVGPVRWKGTASIRLNPNMDDGSSFQNVIQQLGDPNYYFRMKLPVTYPKFIGSTGYPVHYFWSNNRDLAGRGNFLRLSGRPLASFNSNVRPVDGAYVTNGKKVWRINGLTFDNNLVIVRDFLPNDVLPLKTIFVGNTPSRNLDSLWSAEYIYAKAVRNPDGTGPFIDQNPGDKPSSFQVKINSINIAWEEVILDEVRIQDIP